MKAPILKTPRVRLARTVHPVESETAHASGLQSKYPRPLENAARRLAPNGYLCSVCSATTVVFQTACPRCDSVGTMRPQIDPDATMARVVTPGQIGMRPVDRLSSGVECFDLALGGGIARNTVVVILGKRGSGKSTLMLQCMAYAHAQRPLYISAEESSQELSDRMFRLRLRDPSRPNLLFTKSVPEALTAIRETDADLVGVDSIQKFHDPSVDGVMEGISQIKSFVGRLYALSKKDNRTILAISRVTSAMSAVGGSSVEYDPDTVLAVLKGRGDRRVIRPKKNRFGPPVDVPVRLTETGMELDVEAYDRVRNGRFDGDLEDEVLEDDD